MLQPLDPEKRFRALMDAVSHQINSTDFSDAKIAEICYTSTEFVRRHRKFLSLGFPSVARFKEDEMSKKIHISHDDLYREYIENEKTVKECAEFFGCSSGVILSRMKEYGIQARTRGGKPRKETPVLDVPEETPTPPEFSALKEPFEIVNERKRMLERLVLLSVFTELSVQELLEEALELLFEKYGKDEYGETT